MAKKKLTDLAETHVNKVFQVLRYFDPPEMKRVLRFLSSPYFNQSKTLYRLCQALVRCVESGEGGFDRITVWKELFPNQPYDDVNFRKYCSDLLKQLEDYMAHESCRLDESRRDLGTLEFVVNRKIEPLYKSTLRQARNNLQNQPYHSLDYYKNMYGVERQYYMMMDFDVKINAKTNIEEISFNLDIFYWIEKIKLYSAVLSQRKTSNQQYNLHFIDEILQYLERFPMDEVPELAIYYYSFLTLYDEEKEEYYDNLRRMLDQYGHVIPKQEAMELYDSALHYCTGKVNKGNRRFLQEYFDLFDHALQMDVFLMKGELAPWRFNNMVGAALIMGKLDWAENFVEKYKSSLPPATRENTYAFNLARVYRYQRKFDLVLPLLRNLEYEDIGYNIISKMMLVLTYYELEEFEALSSFLESFRVFLNRNKNTLRQRHANYMNLLKFVRRLTRILPGDKTAIEKLRAEITAEKAATVNSEWLLEKLDELT